MGCDPSNFMCLAYKRLGLVVTGIDSKSGHNQNVDNPNLDDSCHSLVCTKPGKTKYSQMDCMPKDFVQSSLVEIRKSKLN